MTVEEDRPLAFALDEDKDKFKEMIPNKTDKETKSNKWLKNSGNPWSE